MFLALALPNIFASLKTPCIRLDGEVYKDGSPYNRAHGKREVEALRLPFGCAVYSPPADTKGFPKGKLEGSREAGVIAGYKLSLGCIWDGGYVLVLVSLGACRHQYDG